MSWLATAAGTEPTLDAVLGLRPDLYEAYAEYVDLVTAAAPPRLAALCRRRVAELHGCEPEQPPAPGLDETERAALALAERLTFHVHDVGDDELAVLRRSLGDPDVVALTSAIALFDVLCRLQVMFEAEPAGRAA